jgi:proline iminopeptidase
MTSQLTTRGSIRSGAFDLGFSIEGSGRPALVIGSHVYYPRTFSGNLRRHLRLAFVDHRGFARPSGLVTAADWSLDAVLDDVELMRVRLELGRVVVIGHSGHGFMALEYAKRFPDAVSHVAMIATGPGHSPAHMALAERAWEEAVCPERKERFAADMAALPEAIAADPDRRFVAFCLAMRARSWFDPAYDAAPLWEGVHLNQGMFDRVWGEVFRDIDVAQGLERLARPVFLGLGRFDHLVAPAVAWDPLRPLFRDLTVRVFDRSSHTPQLEEPAAFDAAFLDWLARTG